MTIETKISCLFAEPWKSAGCKVNIKLIRIPEENETLIKGVVIGPIEPPSWLLSEAVIRGIPATHNVNAELPASEIIRRVAELIQKCAPKEVCPMIAIEPGYIADEIEKNQGGVIVPCGSHYHIGRFDRGSKNFLTSIDHAAGIHYSTLTEALSEIILHAIDLT
jgi:hypothetical protein